MENKFISSKIDYLRLLLYITIILVLLYVGRTLFIPLCFALFLSIIIFPISKWFESKNISKSWSILFGLILVLLPIIGIIILMLRQVFVFAQKWPELQNKIITTVNKIYIMLAEFLDIPILSLKVWVNEGISEGSSGIVLSLLQNTLTASSVSLVLALLIPVYVVLILFYRNIFIQFLIALFPQQAANIKSLVHDTVLTYYKFVKGMIFVYLIVGILNSLGLYFLGIPDPFFYGFITSLLTIIPYIGILIGAIVPIAVAWITFDSIWYPVGIVIIFSFVQILEANVIFPLAVGNKLNINPLIILIVVIGGGILWGVSGMILFIPFIGILKIISDKVDGLKPLSIILGRGEINN